MKAKVKNGESGKFLRGRRLTYAAIMIAVLVLAGVLLFVYRGPPAEPKAAIVDQLGSSLLTGGVGFQNPTFVNDAKELLYRFFPKVDYYSNNATVENYRNLPSQGYKLILWRAHSALDLDSKYIAICTSERESSANYDQYLENEQLTLCNITDPNLFFGITPKFVAECMNGRFEDTVVVLMSCNGLKKGYEATAESFIQRGAKVFISWNGWILPSDNDNGTTMLLSYLINDNNTIDQAVGKIPPFDSGQGLSGLGYYPRDSEEVSNYRIPNYNINTSQSVSGFLKANVLKNEFLRRLRTGRLSVLVV
jgi:hypothetical protein